MSTARFSRLVWLAAAASLVSQLPITLGAVALPAMAAQSGFSTAGIQWVQSLLSLTMAAAVMSASGIAERFGLKKVMAAGLWLMIVGSALAIIAQSTGSAALPVLLVGQTLSGLGGGALLPTSLAAITTTVSRERRGPSVALWGAGTTGGLALGSFVGGTINEIGPWAFTYAPEFIGAILVLLGVRAWKVEAQERPVSLDGPGQVLLLLAVVAVIIAAIQGGEAGWTSTSAVVGFVAFLVLLIAFIARELKTDEPLMDMRMFAGARFTASAVAAFVSLFAVVGAGFLAPVYSGSVLHLPPMQIALVAGATPLIGLIFSPVTGIMMQKFHATTVLVWALVISAASLWLFSLAGSQEASATWWDLFWPLALFGIGVSMMLTSAPTVAVDAVAGPQAAMAGSTNTAIRQIGGALGPAVIGSLFFGAQAGGSTPGEAFQSTMFIVTIVMAITALLPLLASLTTKPGTSGEPQQPAAAGMAK